MEVILEAPRETMEGRRPHVMELVQQLGGKYLIFLLAGDEYGLELAGVREIIGIMDIREVPDTPEFVRGVINLRRKAIPVVDLRLKFGLPQMADSDQTCIIVVDTGTLTGLIVDAVSSVYDIPDADIEPPRQLGVPVDTNFVLGMGKVKDSFAILLDLDEVLTRKELVQLQEAINA